MTLETAVTIAEAGRATGVSERDRLALLEEHRDAVRAGLAEVQTHLAFIEQKIANYEEKLGG